MKKWLILASLIFAFVVNGCGGGSSNTNDANETKVLKVVDDNITLDEDNNKTIDVLANDENAKKLDSVTVPTNGSATIVGNKILYKPNANFNGSDSFEYTASNDTSTATAKVNITVNAVNDAPVANDVNATANEDTNVEITLDATDVDNVSTGSSRVIAGIGALNYEVTQTPSHGSVTIAGNKAIYTPSANYNGNDSFKYKANDGSLDSNEATVNITITPINDAPNLAALGVVHTNEDTNKTITLNAIDVDGDTITFSAISSDNTKAHFIINGNLLTIVPIPNVYTDSNGISVSVTADDGNGGISSKIMTLIIDAVNDAPVAEAGEDKTTGVNEPVDINATATDVDGTIASYEWKEGSTVLSSNKDFSYTPTSEGNHTLTLTVTDDKGATNSDTMKVTAIATYTGAAAPGDFARYYIDDNNRLHFSINGDVFGDLDGELNLTAISNNNTFFMANYNNRNLKIAISNNLGIAVVPTNDNNSTMIAGLKVAGEINTTAIVDKNYIYTEITDDGIEAGILHIDQNGSFTIAYLEDDDESGCWKALDDHIVVQSDTSNCSSVDDSNADAKVVIKPGESRSGIVVDLTEGGFGIGLEQKLITSEEMNGVYDAYAQDSEGDYFYNITISYDGSNFVYVATPYICDESGCSLSTTPELSGNIKINKLCNDYDMPGVMCVDLGDGYENGALGFIDPEDGYFMLMSPTLRIFGVKSNPAGAD